MYTTCRVGVLLSEYHSKVSPPPSLRSHLTSLPMHGLIIRRLYGYIMSTTAWPHVASPQNRGPIQEGCRLLQCTVQTNQIATAVQHKMATCSTQQCSIVASSYAGQWLPCRVDFTFYLKGFGPLKQQLLSCLIWVPLQSAALLVYPAFKVRAHPDVTC